MTPASITSGRHAGLTPGKIALRGWPGRPANPTTTHQGVRWLHAENWIPYQRTNFVTPAFPGYVSGHSSFSRAAAEVLTAMTGTPFFPAVWPLIRFLPTPDWASKKVRAKRSNCNGAPTMMPRTNRISRIWGGIHSPADDFGGRRAGSQAGKETWALAERNTSTPRSRLRRSRFADSSATNANSVSHPVEVSNTVQSTSDLSRSFTNDGPLIDQPFDSISITQTNPAANTAGFRRVITTSLR